MKRLCLLLILLALGALVPSAASAQATAVTGQIEGRVADSSDAVLPGVTVTVRNTQTGFSRNTTTDGEGRYRLSLLPLGLYSVTVELQGFSKVERVDVPLSRFVIAAMSVTQLIYMSEVGALLLGSKIPVKLWELFVIFLLRTLITLPVIAGVAHLLF